MIGLPALGAGLTERLIRKTSFSEQLMLVRAGFILAYTGWIQDLFGFFLFWLVHPRTKERAKSDRPT
jgi:hypothetical protein